MKFSHIEPSLFANEDGDIFRHGIKKLKNSIDSRGYFQVRFKGRLHLAHRIVASALCDGYAHGLDVNHINGIKTDNRACNLEWVTRKENIKHAYAAGLISRAGEGNGRSRLTWADVAVIRERYSSGSVRLADLSEEFGVSLPTIGAITTGGSWKESA